MIKIINKTYISVIDKSAEMLDFTTSRGLKVVLKFKNYENMNNVYSIFKDLYYTVFSVRINKDANAVLIEANEGAKASINPQLNGYIIIFTTD